MVNALKHCSNLCGLTFPVFLISGKDIQCEKGTLTNRKFLRMFVNTFTADDKYSLLNRDNLTQAVEMQLSQKQKTFSEYFSAVSKCRLNFENFQQQEDLQN